VKTREKGYARKPSVLVVDDDPVFLQVTSEALAEGFDIQTAGNATDALAFIDAGVSYAAIVCDLMMPEMNGLDLLRCIRERDMDLPVIVLTADHTLESAMEVMEHRGFRYLTKPVANSALIESVRSAAAFHEMALLRRRAFELCESKGWSAEEERDLDADLSESLENLFMVFQPIIESTGGIFGYEALVRSTGPKLTNPGLLFEAAEELERVQELGRRVRRLVAERMPSAPRAANVFVNLHPLDLDDEELYSRFSPLARVAHRIVLEITERTALSSVRELSKKLETLRQMGYRIAVDDLGAGYAGLASFSELKPEIVKLDMSLIRGLDKCFRKRAIVRSILAVCARDLDTRVVCEGVETSEELAALAELGVDLLQGYLFARPAVDFVTGVLLPTRPSLQPLSQPG
jgi:EAL domain-containing protein (putative c-di-GMP-specific phosphodiesterase class I)/CheY-like chemotaxis protein